MWKIVSFAMETRINFAKAMALTKTIPGMMEIAMNEHEQFQFYFTALLAGEAVTLAAICGMTFKYGGAAPC